MVMTFNKITFLVLLVSVFIISCQDKKKPEQSVNSDTLNINYTVLTALPHDADAFTEGLIIHNNKILESTGQNNSWIAEVNPSTGVQDKKVNLDSRYFGEGITVINNKIYQLTWKSNKGFVYDARTYKLLNEFPYSTEGWGITHDNKNLIMSDGSDKLFFLDTLTYKVVKTLKVTEGNAHPKKLNELEFINGFIFANVWETALILKIDPTNGKVIGRINLSVQANEIRSMYPNADVLNGIAYDANSKALLVTGKWWPKSYLIKLH